MLRSSGQGLSCHVPVVRVKLLFCQIQHFLNLNKLRNTLQHAKTVKPHTLSTHSTVLTNCNSLAVLPQGSRPFSHAFTSLTRVFPTTARAWRTCTRSTRRC